jgi:hypothetical protein
MNVQFKDTCNDMYFNLLIIKILTYYNIMHNTSTKLLMSTFIQNKILDEL